MSKIVSLIRRCEKFYDLPTTKLQRTTSFGVGQRVQLSVRQESPPPNRYNLPSDFENLKQKGKVFSFGICRDAYSKVYIKAHPVVDKSIPGPGSYEVREVPGKEGRKCCFRPKTTNPCKY